MAYLLIQSATNDQTAKKNDALVQKNSILNSGRGALNVIADLTSNYVWRGVSRTQNRPAPQATMEYSDPLGLYTALWGSNVKFPDVQGRTATTEFNIYGGWRHNLEQLDNFRVDVGAIRYYYPKTSGISWTEYYLGGNYKIFEFYVFWSPNTFDLGPGIYYSGDIFHKIPSQFLLGIDGVSVGAHGGYYDLSNKAGNAYSDWLIYLSKALTDDFKASVSYIDTNEKFATSNHNLDNAKAVFILSAVF